VLAKEKMAERLKDIFFTRASMNELGDHIGRRYPDFDKARFLRLVFDDAWETEELKARMRHTTTALHATLPGEFGEALAILKQIAPLLKGFEAMVLPDYVEVYGLDDWRLSLPALGFFTRFGSSEFAIRQFLVRDPEEVMACMSAWADDDNPHVRRLASEGCRPRLPWAMALPDFKRDPAPILPILEKLKEDPSDFVRRSVANNLNDISKDHPDLVLDLCEQWYGDSDQTDWIVRHACRGLLKAGDRRALALFGFADPVDLKIGDLQLDRTTVCIGDELKFSFRLLHDGPAVEKIRLQYDIAFIKAGGRSSSKIFRIAENTYEPGSHVFARKHAFVDLSTRRHFEGKHGITIVVNGRRMAKAEFALKRR
jgi:3-methyladenine DNA glycosylase AlkC